MTEPPASDDAAPDPMELARDITDRYKRGGAPAPQGKRRRRPPPPAKVGRRPHRDDAVPISQVLGDLIKERGWGASWFSYNTASGGRCPECEGLGSLSLDLQYLPDLELVCPVCEARLARGLR